MTLKTTYVLLSEVVEADSNVRDHSDGDPHLVGSIGRLGFLDPILRDDRTGKLIDGHGRLYRLRDLETAGGGEPPEQVQVTAKGWKIPLLTGWASRDDAEAEAAAIALQPKDGRYDNRALYEVLHRQPDLTGLGFGEADIYDLGCRLNGMADDAANMFRSELGDGDGLAGGEDGGVSSNGHKMRSTRESVDPDNVPEVRPSTPPVTQDGDVWHLGPHRLLCGDSTKRETYDRLLDGERPDLLLTDPPYGVSYQSAGNKKRAISGDLSQAAIPVSMAASIDHLADNGRLVVFGGSDQFAMYLSLFDFHLRQQPRLIVWAKEGFVLRHHGFHSQYELAYYGWKGTGGSIWHGDRTVSDIWRITRTRDTDHATEKPVALYEIPAGHLAGPGDIVLDPFAGSGVTVIACERTNRVARVVEKDPHWCDVICFRWQKFSGQAPTRDDGGPVNFIQGDGQMVGEPLAASETAAAE